MTPRLILPESDRAMPWRNGGGTTREVAVEPADGTTFVWRVSIADVTRDGPFSAFPGVDRVLVPIAGRGLRLRGDGIDAVLSEPFVPFAFPGEAPLVATLIDGPVRDFNLMVRRGSARGSVMPVHDACTVALRGVVLVHAARGAARCIGANGRVDDISAGATLRVDGRSETPPALEVRVARGSVALVAAIELE